MNVFVLGVQHGVQWEGGGCPPSKKERYKEFLSDIVVRRGVQYIGEEAPVSVSTFAKTFERHGIRWEQIDMPPAEKAAIGTPVQQSREPYIQESDDNPKVGVTDEGYIYEVASGFYAVLRRDETDAVREEYMFKRILATCGVKESILVICGWMHALELQRRFQGLGHTVERDALYNYGWFGTDLI